MTINKKFYSIAAVVVLFIVLCLLVNYMMKSIKLWNYCNTAITIKLNPKCLLASKFGLTEELENPNISSKDINLAIIKIQMILKNKDPEITNDFSSSSWPVFTHPDGIYTIKYNPKLKPIIIKKDELGYEAPYDAVKFITIDQRDTTKDFNIWISYDLGGGGGLCANTACFNAQKLAGNRAIDIEAYDTFGGGEEILPNLDSSEINFNLTFQPKINSQYVGRISSSYYAGNQRELIKQMLETFELK